MHAANDALWAAIAGELRARGSLDVPAHLDRRSWHSCDHDANCLFTQTCGYPLLTTARDRFTVLGAPCYRVAGCAGNEHRSFIVVRDEASGASTLEDLRDTRFAVNEADSNSGMNLPRRLFAPYTRDGRFFARTLVSGSHAASAEFVSRGIADAAAIDCVTFACLQRYRPATVRRLRVLAETAAAPTPPFATSRHTGPGLVNTLRQALRAVIDGPAYAPIREALFLADVEFCTDDAYAVVLEYERDARRRGYPDLR